jgi:hypothetical protein
VAVNEEWRALFEHRIAEAETALERLRQTVKDVYGARDTPYDRHLEGIAPHFEYVRAAWSEGWMPVLGSDGHPKLPSAAGSPTAMLEQLLGAGQWLTALAARGLLVEALATWHRLQDPFARVRRVPTAQEYRALVELMDARLQLSFNAQTNTFARTDGLVGDVFDYCLKAVTHIAADYRDLELSRVDLKVIADFVKTHPVTTALTLLGVCIGLSILLFAPKPL